MHIEKILLALILCISFNSFSQEKEYEIRTVAFYNVENLFDTINDPKKFDDDRTPDGKDKYTSKIYWDKIDNLSRVLSEIGEEETKTSPAILGICEVENLSVIQDLISSKRLRDKDYGIVHYDSPDERGIDVALLYRKKYFKLLSERTFTLFLFRDDGKRDFTRDQLLVSGLLDGELIHLIVNHWPSRSGGEEKSRPNRIAAAKLNKKIIDSLQRVDAKAKIITMGDLNDDPTNQSVAVVLNAQEKKEKVAATKGLYNPMAAMYRKGFNTLAYRDGLNLFDQIIFSQPFLEKDYATYCFYKAGIYNKDYLITSKGPYKGYPFRSYNYSTYQDGYSDHFPVYIYLIREKK
tara:strand:- start:249067 stop:250113 length:1047 start_codon:yes stop_codon:yes gene_type:complete